jgi:hypothetical protein
LGLFDTGFQRLSQALYIVSTPQSASSKSVDLLPQNIKKLLKEYVGPSRLEELLEDFDYQPPGRLHKTPQGLPIT